MHSCVKKFLEVFTITLFFLLNSCVSSNRFLYGQTLTANELEKVEIVGSVETTFETTIDWRKKEPLLEKTYYELLKIANRNYTGEIEIKNIIIEKHNSYKNLLLFIPAIFSYNIIMSYMNICAKGEVIRYK